MDSLEPVLGWLRDSNNRALLSMIGGSITAVAAAGAWLYTNGFFRPKRVTAPPLLFSPPRNPDGTRAEDVAFDVAMRLNSLPTPADETILFREASRLFQRKAFYDHPEKAFDTGLWIIIVTRLLWEQQVLARATGERQKQAMGVILPLLNLEDVQAHIVGVPSPLLERLVSQRIGDKSAFLADLRAIATTPSRCDSRAFEEQRKPLLLELQAALKRVGIDAPNMGKYEFSPLE